MVLHVWGGDTRRMTPRCGHPDIRPPEARAQDDGLADYNRSYDIYAMGYLMQHLEGWAAFEEVRWMMGVWPWWCGDDGVGLET